MITTTLLERMVLQSMDDVLGVLRSVVTGDVVLSLLERLQDPAPSTTELHTRTPVIADALADTGVDLQLFDRRFLGTRSPALFLRHRKRLWISAHSDTISYIFPRQTCQQMSPLLPNCAHRMPVGTEARAIVMRYDPVATRYLTVSFGRVGTDENGDPIYTADDMPEGGFVPGYDRVALSPDFVFDRNTRRVAGNMDNAAGVAVCLAAIRGIVELATMTGESPDEFGMGFIFPGQEEGPPSESAFFAREARRIAHRASLEFLPDAVINVDGHDSQSPGRTARYGAYVSSLKGPVLPPDVYAELDQVMNELAAFGIDARPTEADASISRSDEPAFMEVIGNILSIGYDILSPHFDAGTPTVHLDGLVNTARALAWLAVGARTRDFGW